MSENPFGILACIFRIFLGRSNLTPEIAVDAILAAVTPHHLLRCKSSESYTPPDFVDKLDEGQDNAQNVMLPLLLFYHYVEVVYITLLFIFALLLCHGDIEINPAPKKFKKKSLSVCQWNLNSLSPHNFSKLTQLKAYISIYKHDFICLSETYLDSSIPDSLLEIDGYDLIRSDHPNDIKRSGVSIYYKESLPIRAINTLYLKEALLLEMTYNNEKVIVSVIYRSPSQNNCEFDSFLRSVESLLSDLKNLSHFYM